MAYSPTTWVSGDTITAQKLNKIETALSNVEIDRDDAILILSEPSTSASITIGKGTYADLVSKLSSATPVHIAVMSFYGTAMLQLGYGDFIIYSPNNNKITFSAYTPTKLNFQWTSSGVSFVT